MSDSQHAQEKAAKRANALRDNLKKRKSFIKESNEAALSKKNKVAVGGGTEEEALKDE